MRCNLLSTHILNQQNQKMCVEEEVQLISKYLHDLHSRNKRGKTQSFSYKSHPTPIKWLGTIVDHVQKTVYVQRISLQKRKIQLISIVQILPHSHQISLPEEKVEQGTAEFDHKTLYSVTWRVAAKDLKSKHRQQ